MARFSNFQWEVNEHGLDSCGRAPHYEIDAKRLLEVTERQNAKYYDWPIHMAEKTWVNIEAFLEAYLIALKTHTGAYPGPVDEAMLERSCARARHEARNR